MQSRTVGWLLSSLKITPGDKQASPVEAQSQHKQQAGGWPLTLAAVPGPRDHPQGAGVGGGACVQHLGQGRRPSPPAAAAHATRGQVPITSQCPLAQPTPRSAHLQPLGVHGHQLPGACAPLPAAGSGAQTLLPGPSNLKGRGGRCGGRGRLSIGCRREGAGPGRRTAREGPRSRLGGNPEGGPRRRLRLDAAGR